MLDFIDNIIFWISKAPPDLDCCSKKESNLLFLLACIVLMVVRALKLSVIVN